MTITTVEIAATAAMERRAIDLQATLNKINASNNKSKFIILFIWT